MNFNRIILSCINIRILLSCKLAVIILLTSFSCTNLAAERKVEIKYDPYWNDLTMFLAGLPVSPDSKLWQKSQLPFYAGHVSEMNTFWGKVKKSAIDVMNPWRAEHIPAGIDRESVFYPLSGADFINLYTMFPNSKYYLMVALEDSGDIPVPLNLDDRRIESGLASLRKSINLYGELNYFQTRIMIKEMKNFNLKGITPVLMVFLSRMGHRVLVVEKVGIDESGQAVLIDSTGGINGKKPKVEGTRIKFQSSGDETVRELVYLNMKLEKDTISSSTSTGIYLGNYIKNSCTIIKAGCYIFHENRFREVMDFILANSRIIVQDDSGIPYRAFKNDIWNIRLYGVYIPLYPITDTTVYKQDDLTQSYKKGSLALPFNFGYGSLLGKNKSNLMIAEKKAMNR